MKRYISRRVTVLSLLSVSILPNFLFTSLVRSENKLFSNYKIGNKNAKIKVKEFFSLTCGHCKNFHLKTFPILKKEAIDTGIIEFEFVDYPLDKLAMLATTLVRSINVESYLDAINILFRKQENWVFSNSQVEELYEIGKIFGVSKNKFDQIIENYDLMQKILNNMEKESKKFDIASTPTFVINEKYKITGNISYEQFKEKILQYTKLKIENG